MEDRKKQIIEDIAQIICLMPKKCDDCSKYDCQAKDLAEAIYINKIGPARKIEIHYNPPYEYRFAVVEYYCRQGKPLKVESYYIYGEELKTGEQLRCWSGDILSTNFSVKEDGFTTHAEATARMKELKGERK